VFANHEMTFEQQGTTISVIARNKKQELWSRANRPGLEVRYEVSLRRDSISIENVRRQHSSGRPGRLRQRPHVERFDQAGKVTGPH